MGVPLSPTSVSDGDSAAGGGEGSSVIGLDRALDMSPESPSYRPCRLPKRHRDEPIDGNSQAHPGIKHRATDGAVTSSSSMNLDETGVRLIARPEFRSGTSLPDPSPNQDDSTIHAKSRSSTPRRWDGRASVSGSGLKPTRLRQLLPRTLRESLQSGGRPDSVTYQVTHLGEDIQVCARDGQGSLKTKMVSWTIDPDVPITLSGTFFFFFFFFFFSLPSPGSVARINHKKQLPLSPGVRTDDPGPQSTKVTSAN